MMDEQLGQFFVLVSGLIIMLGFVIFPLFLLLQINGDPNRSSSNSRQLFFSIPNQNVDANYQQAALVPLHLGDMTNVNSPLYAFWSQLANSHLQQPLHYSNQPLPETQISPFQSSQFQLNQYQNQYQNQPAAIPNTKQTNAFSYYFLPIQAIPKSPLKNEILPNSGGFNRGSIESSQKSQYSVQQQQQQQQYQQNNKVAGGFVRGHVEYRPRPVVTGNKNAFNRGAVEGHGGPLRYNRQGGNVVCYFASFAGYREGSGQFLPENIEPRLCTHLIYAFASIDRRKDTIVEGDYHTDIELGFYQRVVGLKKKNPSLKVLLSVGGWSDSGDGKYSKLANSPEKRRKFAWESRAYLKKHGFDGLAIDWHYPKCWQSNCAAGPDSDKEAFSFLVRDLKNAYASDGLLVSATLSGYKEVIDVAYDVRSLSQYLDLMNVMTYDYHGSWEGITGHISPLFQGPATVDLYPNYNSNFTMNYYASLGADPTKLIMGIPFYGQSYELKYPGDSGIGSETKGAGEAGEFTQQEGMLSYYEICSRVRNKGWRINPDFKGSWGPYAHSNSQWVSFDDPDMVRKKSRFVKGNGFGGIFTWTMDLDDFKNECKGPSRYPLLKSIAEEIMGGPIDISQGDQNEVTTTTMSPFIPTTQQMTTYPPTTTTTTMRTTTNYYPTTSTTSMMPWQTTSMTTSTQYPDQMTSEEPDQSPETTIPSTTTTSTSTQSWWDTSTTTTTEIPTTSTTTQTTTTTATRPPTPLPCFTTTTRPTQPSQNCNDYTDKAYGRDCYSYYRCSGSRWRLERCANGLEWDSHTLRCDYPMIAMCSRQTTTYRPSTTQNSNDNNMDFSTCSPGEYMPAKNCDQYYLCDNGMKKLQSCGPGLHWNQAKKACDWPASANCAGNRSDMRYKNAPCSEGAFTGSDTDCTVYFVCNHGKNIMFRCQEGLYWNKDKMVCDWKNNVQCSAENIGDSGGSEMTEPTWTTSTTSTSTWAPWTPSSTMSTTSWTTERPRPTSGPSSTVSTTPFPQVDGSQSNLNDQNFMLVCYFTNWAWYRPGNGKYVPENIDANLCTHIVYGFAVLGYDDMVIKPHDSWADIDNNFYKRVTDFKQKGKKVTIAIGGWNDSAGDKYSRLVNSPQARRKFVQNVVEFIKKWNFDGLDLDWEYPKCWQTECNKGPDSDKPNFAQFVRELSEAFKPDGLLLSTAVSPSKIIIDLGYDVPQLSRYFDWISVMTYDFHGQWDKKTGHVAPLYFHEEDDYFYFNANYSINYWINKGADKKKIIMGMPLYGQSFTLVNPQDHGLNAPTSGGGTAGEFTRASGFLAYYEICNNIKNKGWKVVTDDEGAMGPYAYSGNQWVSYDDVDMIKKKSQFVRDLDIGGAMVWALDLDDFTNTCGQGKYPLLTTIKNVLSQPRNKYISSSSSNSRPVQQFKGSSNSLSSSSSNKNYLKPKPTSSWSSSSQKTDWNQQKVKNQENCEDEPFREHESDCTKYYYCVHGRYMEQRCPSGTYWNRDHCDWECGSKNNQNQGAPMASSTTTRRTTTYRTTTTRNTTPRMTTARPATGSGSESGTSGTAVTTARPSSTTADYCKVNWCPTQPPTTTTHRPVDVPQTDYIVVCYFTNWAWYRQGKGKYKPEDINYNLCTHIAYGFAVLNPTTLTIRPHDGWADIDNKFYEQVVALKKKGVKVVIAIGGWNDSLGDKYSRLVRDPEARRRFIENVIEFIEKWGFDGLDLDWEYPKCWQVDCNKGPDSDKENFAIFLRELKTAFAPRGLTLSAAVSPSNKVIDGGYDVPAVSKYLDWISVMTYDYFGQWDKKTGHVAPFYHHKEVDNPNFNTNFTINYWIDKGADRKKIIMGMPMYGQSFSLSEAKNTGLNSKTYGGGEAGEFTRQQGFLAYYEICVRVQQRGWTVVRDESGAMGPYAYKGNQWVSYDDIAMIRRKSKYIKEMKLGGGMIWALDLDDFRGTCNCEEHPLLKTINRVLRNYPEADPNCT